MKDLAPEILETCGITIRPYEIDRAAFANFQGRYRDPRAFIHAEKLLEYFISEQWLQFKPDEVYVDVAAQDCPFTEYVRNNYRSRGYRQDLYYLRPGINDWDLGCDACQLPFADAEVSKISLHNSIEHFEGDSDSLFMREAERVLAPGGLMCIVPLYMAEQHSEQSEAGWTDELGIKHLWGKGATFARLYSPQTLMERIIRPSLGLLPSIYRAMTVPELNGQPFYFAVFQKQ